jgi:hypothetical protein
VQTAENQYLRQKIAAGEAIRYWQLSDVVEARYDVADRPMQGRMDAFFFLTSHKNFIPHEYPCRTEFIKAFRGERPVPLADFSVSRWWLPFGSDRVDLSGFWFRPTRVAAWARTFIEVEERGEAKFRLATCGGANLEVNGKNLGFMAPYSRNLENSAEFSANLIAGLNEVRIYFDDLAERDARFYFQLDYLQGPVARVAMQVPVDIAVAARLEQILGGMAFERPAYFSGEVAIQLPEPLPPGVLARVEIEGDFMSTERFSRELEVSEGSTRLVVGDAEELPADFRHFRLKFAVDGFEVSRLIGVEICHAERQGDAPASLARRIDEALDEVAKQAERDTVRAFARLALGRSGPDTDDMIAAMLPAIEDCHDCADFILVPLLWCRTAWPERIDAELRERIDNAILNYRYWLDEPGNDVQWYFSENHALLFHTAAYLAGALLPEARFRRSGRIGKEQAAIGENRVREWLDHFEQWEMAEWNSVPYFPIDLKGLTALYALAPHHDIRDRAGKAIIRLTEIIARSSHHGMVTASQGRSYEHTLRAGRSLELSGIARLLWGRGWFGRRFHSLPQLAVCLRDHGLEIPPAYTNIAVHNSDDALEWCFAQGENRFAALYHYKTRDFAVGSIAGYRWGNWGYQETVVHARLGTKPEAQIWVNHPGETILSGYGRPSFWGGCGTLPRIHQYKSLVLVDFAIHEGQLDFTHAWFPLDEFDEASIDGKIALARSGNGVAILVGSRELELVTEGPTRGTELRMAGPKGRWLLRLGGARHGVSLEAAGKEFSSLHIQEAGGDFILRDPEYGKVVFRETGIVEAEGRTIDPKSWNVAGESRKFTAAAEGRLPISSLA